jgi:paraquat-inducible protein B
MSTTPPSVPIVPSRRSLWERISIVWIIPFVALLIALGVAWQAYTDRGPVIRILFDNAEGVKSGATELKFRDVAVGVVEKVGFTEDLSQVAVDVRIDKDVAPFVDSAATFWVVRPEVSVRGVTGLGTVLSGVHIEGSWDTVADTVGTVFNGLESSPLIRPGEQGLQIALRASGQTQLDENLPILYRGIEVGRMGKSVISKDGGFTIAEAIIYEPHDRLISKSTRFWDTSGFSFSFGAGGAELNFTSLATLLSGGLTFETLVSSDEPISDGQIFEVYDDEASAKASVYSSSDVEPLEVTAIFSDGIAGLAVGAPVELNGLQIGEVSNLNGIVDRTQFGDARVRLRATLAIQPARLGLPMEEPTKEAALSFLNEQMITRSLRARLASASLLTGGLKVEIVSVPSEPGFSMNMMSVRDISVPNIPVTKSEITDVSATAEGVFGRITELPIEQLFQSAIDFLKSATNFVNDDQLREAPGEVVGLLEDVRGLVGSEAAQNVPVALNSALVRIETLVASLDEQNAVARLMTSLEAVSDAATKVSGATENLPGVLSEIEGLAAKANALPLDELLDETRSLIRSVNTVTSSEAIQKLPSEITAALQQVEGTLSDLREERGIARLVSSIEAVGDAAGQIGGAIVGVPELIAQAEALIAKANLLPLDKLVDQGVTLMAHVDELLAAQGVKELPGAMGAALEEVRLTLSDLRRERGLERLFAAVDAVSAAAQSADKSIQGVPALIDQLNALAAKANSVPINDVADNLSELLKSANAIIGTQEMQELPANLADALGELQATLSELREGGAVENVNKTLQSARVAADQIAISVQDLPRLIERMTRLLTQASATLQSYDGQSELNRGARDALRDIAQAAEAVSSLARTIERNPNSLLLGR